MTGSPLRIAHARLSINSIGAALSEAFAEPGLDDDPVLIRVREALDGHAGLPPTGYCRPRARAPS
ncbi:hypothetical protein [Streptomyces sp. NBC_00335]|uniref:hypothetical protein n=1 Tax=Streptomyces sp. NBC_00335 TaxID=2975714 RepID=UPI003FA7DECE